MISPLPQQIVRFLCGAVLAFSAVTMCSCEATNSLAKVRENPDDPEGPPIAAGRVTQVVIVAPRGEFFDSDGNGFRDSTRIVAFLFDEFSTGKTVAVGGDAATPYAEIVLLLDELSKAGIPKVGLLTDIE